MLKRKKSAHIEKIILNYSNFAYSEIIENFSEHDRLLETDLQSLECYKMYQIEQSHNSFNDGELNDHLYRIYYSNKMETTTLMRRWISYFVKQYPEQITTKVKTYLDSKKLTLEDWLRCVKEGKRGDILCVYLLSLATGVHTVVHLKHNKLWCMLKEIPKMHQELIKQCDKHLAYLGFRVFLRLNERPPPLNILGTVSGSDPETQQLLLASVSKQIKPEFTGTTSVSIDTTSATANINLSTFRKASAAVGSEAQLK